MRFWISLVSAAVLAAAVQAPKLPPPYQTRSAANPPKVIPRPPGAELKLPDGFHIEAWAEGFSTPRFMVQGPRKEILLSDSSDAPDGTVWYLTDSPDHRRPQTRKRLITGLDRPYGLAFWKDYLYVAETTSVKRYRYDANAGTVGKGEQVVSMRDFEDGHWTRTILFDRAGQKFYLAIGSRSNVSPGEPAMRAAINRFNPDGSGHEIFASGTRNPIGLRWYPNTDTLWASVQERDALGDDLVPDYITSIKQGAFYGWPYSYIGTHEDPRNRGLRPDLVSKTTAPDLPFQAHMAVLDLLFYTGTQFPQEYQGGAFVACHGSWNRSQRVGYSVVFVPFKNARPASGPRDFLTGFMLAPNRKEVWGRPVGLLQLPDGSLLLSDDGGQKVWRIWYGK